MRYCHHPLGESLLYDAEAEYPVHRHYPCKEKGVSGGAMERSLQAVHTDDAGRRNTALGERITRYYYQYLNEREPEQLRLAV